MSSLTIASRQKQLVDGLVEAVVTLSGTLDKSTIRLFEDEISTLLAKKPHRIILETAALNHIHGQALECLNRAHLAQLAHGGELVMVNKHEVTESLQMEDRDLEGVRVVKVIGHLDIRGVSSIENRFLQHFEAPNPRVLVDFSAADSLSSLGIRMLVRGIKSAAARGGRTLILNPTPPIASALETAGFAHYIARGIDSEIAEGLRNL